MEDVRVYGDVSGLSQKDFDEMKDELPFNKVVYKDEVLNVDYEGHYIDIDDFLEELVKRLPKAAWAKVDFIDHVEWHLTRHEILEGKLTSRTVNADHALESTKN
ncbi:MAG: hypothetical protein BA863_14935 [Desulfovibrio sp. S3730MH75]|nr:MAG: hypothetical protein BA863_14935 [Desulfovibrio sp. S3730MH75]